MPDTIITELYRADAERTQEVATTVKLDGEQTYNGQYTLVTDIIFSGIAREIPLSNDKLKVYLSNEHYSIYLFSSDSDLVTKVKTTLEQINDDNYGVDIATTKDTIYIKSNNGHHLTSMMKTLETITSCTEPDLYHEITIAPVRTPYRFGP